MLQSKFMFLVSFRQQKGEPWSTLVNGLSCYEAHLQGLRLEKVLRNVSIGKQLKVIRCEYYTQVSTDTFGALVKWSFASFIKQYWMLSEIPQSHGTGVFSDSHEHSKIAISFKMDRNQKVKLVKGGQLLLYVLINWPSLFPFDVEK